jgi:hypothetical protein
MRWLMGLAVTASVLWGGYWFVGAQAIRQGVEQALDLAPALQAESVEVQGFPNRFDVTLTAPRLQQGQLAWSAPFVQVFALSYRPHHLVAVFAQSQRFEAAGLLVTLDTADLRASVVMRPELTLPLDRTALVAQRPVVGVNGATHRAGTLRAASRDLGAGRHDLVIEIDSLLPDAGLMSMLDPDRHWPRAFDLARLTATAGFDAPIDRETLARGLPQPRELMLTGGRLAWEGTQIDATGAVRWDAGGLAQGDVEITVTGWAALFATLRDAGAIATDQAPMIEGLLRGLSAGSGDDRLTLPLAVRNGAVLLGPLRLGDLPRMPL